LLLPSHIFFFALPPSVRLSRFHYSKVWADALQNTSDIAFTDKVLKRTTHVQFHYRWSQIADKQRVYLNCAYGDEQCCAQTNQGTPNCFDAPSTSSALVNLFLLTLIYSVLAVSGRTHAETHAAARTRHAMPEK